MRPGTTLPNRLRSWFGTFAALALLVAGLAYGATLVVRIGLEKDAVAAAGRVADTVIRPALHRTDATAPLADRRYADLRQTVVKRVIAPPVDAVTIWNENGMVMFDLRRSRLGQTFDGMRDTIHDAKIQGSLRDVEGETFRAFVGVGLPGGDAVVVEVDRPYASITAQADRRWHPWIARGIQAAVAFAALYVIAVALSIADKRRRARVVEKLPEPQRSSNAAPKPTEEAHVSVGRRHTDDRGGSAPDAPAYMQPGFREHAEARREAEDALVRAHQALDASELERQRLQDRLTQAETELADARRRLAELGATAGR
jgi:hypothetical protein